MRFSQFALVFGVFSLLLAAGFIARTDMVLGRTIHAAMNREARKIGADLVVEEVRPHGLFSLEFRDVWIRIPRGDHALEIVAERVQVRPDLSSLLEGSPRPSAIKIINGHAVWKPWIREAKKASPQPTSPTSATTSTAAPAPRPRAAIDVDVTLVNVTMESLVAPVITAAPLKFNRLDLHWAGRMEVTRASGYGVFPDRVAFGVHSVKGARSERIRLEANTPTELSAWIKGKTNPGMSVGAVSICLKCVDILKLEDAKFQLEWREGAVAALETPAAYVAISDREIEIKADDMEFPAARDFGLQARVTDTRIKFNPGTREIEVASRFVDTEGGRLDVQAALGSAIRAKIFAEDFDTSRVLDAIHAPTAIRPGLVTGTVEVHYDIQAGTVDTTSAITATNSRIEIARLSATPLEVRRTTLRFDALLDLDGAALSVSRGRLDLGPSAVLNFGGRVLRTGNGAAFDAFVGGQDILAATIRDALPATISQVAEDAILDGTFEFSLRVQGNTEDSSDLVVDGHLEGNVEVLRDSPAADPNTLISVGPPPGLSARLSQHWRTYQQLPVLVPQVLLSAEDASFFRHPGFDWAGLKAAMAHNLEHKSFERGGSTISQQVAKNVFLNQERTIARKLQEAYLTWRMEQVVPKQRILEIYLNIADWGGGVQGIERAAQRYFKTSADQLTAPELALLAAILPNPSRFGGHILKGSIARSRAEKVGRILVNLRFLNQIDMASWARWNREVQSGKFGRLDLQICDAEC